MNKIQYVLLAIITVLTVFIIYLKTGNFLESDLFSAVSTEQTSQFTTDIPVDVTFLIVDLKYNEKQGVKICEIQPGSLSVFNGWDYVLDKYGLVPKMFCNFVKQFQDQGWYIFDDVSDFKFKDVLLEKGWIAEESLETLVNNPQFYTRSQMPVKDPYNLADYHGILYARQWKIMSIEDFRKHYPGIIVIDGASFPYKGDKYKMSQLLTTDERLRAVKPAWNVFPKAFSTHLVNQIQQEIPSDILVIKPLRSTRGRGVIILKKEDLESTLKYILADSKEDLKSNPDPSYNYWAKDKCDCFIVEEFVQSDPVIAPHLNNQPYDGTMRIVFALVYHQETPDVVYFEGHWKLPEKSLSEQGTLTELHRSYAHDDNFLSVEPELLQKIEDQLYEPMILLYQQMLSTSH